MATSAFRFAPSLAGTGQLMRDLLLNSQGQIDMEVAPTASPVPPAPNFDRARAAFALTGGNNVINSEADIRRQTLLGLQREAQMQAAMRDGKWAVDQLKAQQARAGNDRQNGVVDGIAYRNGQPVGFSGNVPGVAPGIPAGGFTDDERQRFTQRMLAMASQPRSFGQVPNIVLADGMAASPTPSAAPTVAPVAPVEVPVAPAATPSMRNIWNLLPQTEQGLPDDRPSVASRISREALGMLPQGRTVQERQANQANTERGRAARSDLGVFESNLSSVLKEVSASQGIQVDEDILADTVLAESAAAETQGLGKGTLTWSLPTGPGIGFTIAERLKVDPKVLVRWAQDRKKGKVARR